jgi:glutaredoxin
MKYTIIGLEEVCSQCKSAVSFATARKLDFDYIAVSKDLSLDEAREMTGTKFTEFPQVIAENNGRRVILSSFASFMQFVNSRK